MTKSYRLGIKELDFETRRKVFHMSAIIVPITYLFLSKLYMNLLLAAITACVLSLDLLRHRDKKVEDSVNKYLSKFMRPNELSGNKRLSGASFMFLGYLITGVFCSKGIAISAWCVLIISDALAALVGKKFGKIRRSGKSIEGSAAFFASSVMIGIVSGVFIGYQTSFLIIVICSVITSFAEHHSRKLCDDNLLIPVTYAFSNIVLSFMFL
jgi:dolichol kinase